MTLVTYNSRFTIRQNVPIIIQKDIMSLSNTFLGLFICWQPVAIWQQAGIYNNWLGHLRKYSEHIDINQANRTQTQHARILSIHFFNKMNGQTQCLKDKNIIYFGKKGVESNNGRAKDRAPSSSPSQQYDARVSVSTDALPSCCTHLMGCSQTCSPDMAQHSHQDCCPLGYRCYHRLGAAIHPHHQDLQLWRPAGHARMTSSRRGEAYRSEGGEMPLGSVSCSTSTNRGCFHRVPVGEFCEFMLGNWKDRRSDILEMRKIQASVSESFMGNEYIFMKTKKISVSS